MPARRCARERGAARLGQAAAVRRGAAPCPGLAASLRRLGEPRLGSCS